MVHIAWLRASTNKPCWILLRKTDLTSHAGAFGTINVAPYPCVVARHTTAHLTFWTLGIAAEALC
jgi:hypothetical protein